MESLEVDKFCRAFLSFVKLLYRYPSLSKLLLVAGVSVMLDV
jgi:hypothetical protein